MEGAEAPSCRRRAGALRPPEAAFWRREYASNWPG